MRLDSTRLNFTRRVLLLLAFCTLALTGKSQGTIQSEVKTIPSSLAASAVSRDDSKEIWDRLSIEGQPLHPDNPINGEKDIFPEFTRELLRVQWRPDDPIDLYVIRPAGVEKPPVILYLYGYPSDSSVFLNNDLCKKLTSQGFAAVGFVSALTGSRYHSRPLKEWFVSELQESMGTSIHDVQMILNYLDTRHDLDTTRMGMFGEGSGGAIAILSAATDSRIKALDVLNPWGDWPEWLAKSSLIPDHERSDYLTAAFQARVASLDPIQSMAALGNRPFRLQEAWFDRTMPPGVRDTFVKALPAGTDHVIYKDVKEYQEQASSNGRMLLWIKASLAKLHQASTIERSLLITKQAE